jgi:hypothetical protein
LKHRKLSLVGIDLFVRLGDLGLRVRVRVAHVQEHAGADQGDTD